MKLLRAIEDGVFADLERWLVKIECNFKLTPLTLTRFFSLVAIGVGFVHNWQKYVAGGSLQLFISAVAVGFGLALLPLLCSFLRQVTKPFKRINPFRYYHWCVVIRWSLLIVLFSAVFIGIGWFHLQAGCTLAAYYLLGCRPVVV
jgi:hypothetical protein